MPARIRLVALGETALAILLICAVGLTVPGQWGLLQLAPHPLWLASLAIAARYGGTAGYLAGALAAAALALLIWTRPEAPFQPLTDRDLVQPILLFVTTATLSEIVRGPHRRAAEAESGRAAAEERLRALEERHEAILEVKAELEGQILDQSPSLALLLETARGLASRDCVDRQRSALQLVAGLLDASSCVLYMDDGGVLRRRGSWPPGAHAPPDLLVPTPDSLVGEVLVTQRIATIRDRIVAADRRVGTGSDPAMAGPLLDECG